MANCRLFSILLAFVVYFTPFLEGTQGYFQHGYGTKSNGMGGVGAAYPQDTIIPSINPAGMYWVGNRFDVAIGVFSPRREYSYTGFGGDHVKSQSNYFPIPALGYNWRRDKNTTLGIAMYANGGMNTNYPRNNPAFGTSNRMGVDYAQAILAPTLAARITPCQSIGVSFLLGAQRIHFRGLQNFEAFSAHPTRVTNNGYDYAAGAGVRVGWMGRIFPSLWLGGAFSTKIYMTKFSDYEGLIAHQGRLDIPANYTVGLMYQLSPDVHFCFDVQGILYHDVPAIGHSQNRIFTDGLGGDDGAGFGWRNITAFKVGADWKVSPCFIVRAGYPGGPVPYSSANIDFNILAPAVVENHLTVGFTIILPYNYEFDASYMHAFKNSKKGISSFGLGEVKHTMYQNFFQIQIGKCI